MDYHKNQGPGCVGLRRYAEDRLQMKTDTSQQSSAEERRLLHELQVHQIELEVQNEELRRANEDLDAALGKFIDLYDFAPVGYLTLDPQGTIRTVNLTGASLLGEERSRLIGRPFSSFITNGESDFNGLLAASFAGQEKKSCELMLGSAEKAPHYVRIEVQRSCSGAECQIAVIDITELHQKDYLLITQNRLAAMGEMVDNIAHQWRTPLNALGLHIQQLSLCYDQGELTRDCLAKAVSQSMQLIRHMSQTIDDFRNYFKPEKKKIDFKAHDAVIHALSLLEANGKKQPIEINVIENCDCRIHGSPNEFLQAILNILVNAMDALSEKQTSDPKITITVGMEGDRAAITIADNAGGIPEAELDLIFEPYVTTKDPEKGTGIGLYMSKNIVEKNMGGTLTACNISGGAQFRIEI